MLLTAEEVASTIQQKLRRSTSGGGLLVKGKVTTPKMRRTPGRARNPPAKGGGFVRFLTSRQQKVADSSTFSQLSKE